MVLSLGSRPARARDPKHIVNNRAERQLFPCRPDQGIGAKSKVDYSRERMSLRRWRAGPGGGCRGRRRLRRSRGRRNGQTDCRGRGGGGGWMTGGARE